MKAIQKSITSQDVSNALIALVAAYLLASALSGVAEYGFKKFMAGAGIFVLAFLGVSIVGIVIGRIVKRFRKPAKDTNNAASVV